jgi:hypothetical protein
MSKSFLNLLASIRHQDWQYIVTLDEAWFHFANQYEQIWLSDAEDPPEIPRHMISHRKSRPDCGMEPAWLPVVQRAAQRAEMD